MIDIDTSALRRAHRKNCICAAGDQCLEMALIDEVDRLRFALAHAKYEARDEGEAANRGYGALLAEKNAEIDRLRARVHQIDVAHTIAVQRLAEVEAERDDWKDDHDNACKEWSRETRRAEAAEARLVEVEAERDTAVTNGRAVYERMTWLEQRLSDVLALCDNWDGYANEVTKGHASRRFRVAAEGNAR